MKDYLIELYQAEVELIAGGGGVFEIMRDGQLVFSKRQERRFPSDEELQTLGL